MCIFTNERDKGNQLFYWLCFGAWEFLHKWIKQITQFRNANEIIIKEFRKSSHNAWIYLYISGLARPQGRPPTRIINIKMKKPCQDTDISTFRSHFENKDPNRNWFIDSNPTKFCRGLVYSKVGFGSMYQFLLGSLFSKWDLKVGISVSWQGFFIFMLRIRVGGLPCGLARPLMTQYFNLLETMLDMGSKTRTSVSRTEHSSHHLFARMS